jgi:Fur family ferric uptake transcriptional regulator
MSSEAVESKSRSTRQAAAIESAMSGTEAFRSAQDVYSELRSRGESVGLTTVYRRLQAMAEAGSLDILQQPGGEVLYRLCSSDRHHHHLVCRVCGRTVEVEGPGVETWARKVADQHGFANLEHTLELFGTCLDCAADAAPPARDGS